MSGARAKLLALLAALSGPALLAAQAPPAAPPRPAPPTVPSLTVHLAPQPATVGDRVEATLTLSAPVASLAGPPRFPVWQQSWGDAEIAEKGEPKKVSEAGGVAVWQQRLVLTAFRTGPVALPPVAVALPGKERTA
ncbi:MAG TPA: hypothetical protein VGE98_10165, partial [Thermoanaerobaculia bacterium]